MALNAYMSELLSKYNKYWDIHGTPEADILWDDLYDTYGDGTLELVEPFINMGESGIIDATEYLKNADAVYPEFLDILESMGVKAFKVDVRKAFAGRAEYFFNATRDTSVKLEKNPDAEDEHYAIFKVV